MPCVHDRRVCIVYSVTAERDEGLTHSLGGPTTDNSRPSSPAPNQTTDPVFSKVREAQRRGLFFSLPSPTTEIKDPHFSRVQTKKSGFHKPSVENKKKT